MKRIFLVLLIAAAVAFAGFGLNGAGSGYIGKHMEYGTKMAEMNMFHGRLLLNMKAEIGLNQDQVDKIEKMSLVFQESVIKRMADTKVKELKLANYLQGDKIDRKVVEKMVKEISELKTGLQIDRIYYLLDIRGLLTPEQIAKAEELKRTVRRRAFFGDREGRTGKRPYRPAKK